MVEPITGFELQSQPPFLLYRNDRSKIRGFWFYSTTECDRIGKLVKSLIKETQAKNEQQQQQQQQQTSTTLATTKTPKNTNNNVNILSMLSKAQEDFNKVTTNVGPSSGVKIDAGGIPQAPPPNMVLNNPSVMSFFGAIPTDHASLQRLKPSVVPPVHTVDEIEKKQKHRATTPKQQQQHQQQHQHNDSSNGIGGNNGLIIKNNARGTSPQAETELGSSPLVTFFNSVNLGGNPMGINKKAFPIINAKKVTDIEFEQTRPGGPEKGGNNNETLQKSQQNVLNAIVCNANKPALMPPTMFETVTTATSTNTAGGGGATTITQHQHQGSTIQNQHDRNGGNGTLTPLTKDQLIKAMNYLLKNDVGFTEKLHQAYLKSCGN